MVKVKFGEASAAAWVFFLWLAVGLELSSYISDALSWIYFLLSSVTFLVYTAVKDFRPKILQGPTFEEKRYALTRVCLVILKGPVRLTVRRTLIFLGVLGAWIAAFLLLLAFTSRRFGEATQQFILVGILPLLVVINLLEVTWKNADARQ
jgi:hypothetical protein